jgi:hypothetical protein
MESWHEAQPLALFECTAVRQENAEPGSFINASLVFMATYSDLFKFNLEQGNVSIPLEMLLVVPKKNYNIPSIWNLKGEFAVKKYNGEAHILGAVATEGSITKYKAKLPLDLMSMNTTSFETKGVIETEVRSGEGKLKKKERTDVVCRRDADKE